MAHLRDVGHAVGEYVGDGQGDGDAEGELEEPMDVGAGPDADEGLIDEDEDSSDNAHPLLFFYDCEATGFSIYDDHITEIAAKVVRVPLNSVSKPSFSSLIHTPHNIPKKGMLKNIHFDYTYLMIHVSAVSAITGITTALLRHEQPLSAVLQDFLKWLVLTTQEVSEASHAPHFPGIYK